MSGMRNELPPFESKFITKVRNKQFHHFMNNLPHREIAKALNVTRQHVSALAKKGLPTTSLDAARAWYDGNVQTRYSKGRHRRVPVMLTPIPREWEEMDFELEEPEWSPAPIKLVDLPDLKTLTDVEVEAWLDRNVDTPEQAAEVAGILLQAIRLRIDWMPDVMAERVNPLDPELARRELDHWVDTFNRECFTDGTNETTP